MSVIIVPKIWPDDAATPDSTPTLPKNQLIPDVRTQYIADKTLFNTFFFNEHLNDGTHDYRMMKLPILQNGNDIGTLSLFGAAGDIGYENTGNDFWISNPNDNYRVPMKAILVNSNSALPYTFTAKANHRYIAMFTVSLAVEYYMLAPYETLTGQILKNGSAISTVNMAASTKGISLLPARTLFPSGPDTEAISSIQMADVLSYGVDTIVTYSLSLNFAPSSLIIALYNIMIMEI